MLLKNRSLQVKLVKATKNEDGETNDSSLNLGPILDDAERIRDMVIETVASVAVIIVGVKVVDAGCKIAVALASRGFRL